MVSRGDLRVTVKTNQKRTIRRVRKVAKRPSRSVNPKRVAKKRRARKRYITKKRITEADRIYARGRAFQRKKTGELNRKKIQRRAELAAIDLWRPEEVESTPIEIDESSLTAKPSPTDIGEPTLNGEVKRLITIFGSLSIRSETIPQLELTLATKQC